MTVLRCNARRCRCSFKKNVAVKKTNMPCAQRLIIRTPIVHVNSVYTVTLCLHNVTDVHNMRHPFIWAVFFFFQTFISVCSNGQVSVPLRSLSVIPTLLMMSVFLFVLLDEVKQLLWGRGNVIGRVL